MDCMQLPARLVSETAGHCKQALTCMVAWFAAAAAQEMRKGCARADSALASLEHIVTLALSWRSCSWPWPSSIGTGGAGHP